VYGADPVVPSRWWQFIHSQQCIHSVSLSQLFYTLAGFSMICFLLNHLIETSHESVVTKHSFCKVPYPPAHGIRLKRYRTQSHLAPTTQFGNAHQHHAPTRRQPDNQWPLQPNHCPGLSVDHIIISIYLCHIFMTRSALVS